MSTPGSETVFTLDTSGLSCPLPVLRAQKKLRELPSGGMLRLVSTDPVSEKELPLFCRQAGYTLLSSDRQEETYLFLIHKPA